MTTFPEAFFRRKKLRRKCGKMYCKTLKGCYITGKRVYASFFFTSKKNETRPDQNTNPDRENVFPLPGPGHHTKIGDTE